MPDAATLKQLVAQGMTQQEIVDWTLETTGEVVTREAVSHAMRRAKIKPANPRPRYHEEIPWRVRTEHAHHPFVRMLRLDAQEHHGEPVDDKYDQNALKAFRRRLDGHNASVHYDPEHPEGFVLVAPRRKGERLVRYPD